MLCYNLVISIFPQAVNTKSFPVFMHVSSTSLTWMHPFLKTGTFQRRASLTRAASSRPTSRSLSAAPGFFISTTAQARLHPGHTHLVQVKGKRGGKIGKTFLIMPFSCIVTLVFTQRSTMTMVHGCYTLKAPYFMHISPSFSYYRFDEDAK